MSAETCPHYLVLTEEATTSPTPSVRMLRHLATAAVRCRSRCPLGGTGGRFARFCRDRPCPGPDGRREGRRRLGGVVRPDRRRRPGIETLLTLVYSEGVVRGQSASSGWSICWRHPGCPVRARREGRAGGRPRCGRRRLLPLRQAHAPGDPPPSHQRLHALRGAAGDGLRQRRRDPAGPTSSDRAGSSDDAGSGSSSSVARSPASSTRPSSTRGGSASAR